MTRQSLATGPAGAALLALERGQDARPALLDLVSQPVRAHPDDASLFDGAPAVGFALAAIPHTRALAELDANVVRITDARLCAAYQRIRTERLPCKREFDLVSGLTGLGVYFLRRDYRVLLRDVLHYVVRLTRPRTDGLPGWWAADAPTAAGPAWVGGHGNFGIAHGIAGPLALLALALRRDITVPGHEAAIDRICRWFDHWRCGTPPRAWWPEAITRADIARKTVRNGTPGRPSWCYGTPGITRALQVAGLALDDDRRQRSAADILAWCATDPAQLAQLGDVSLCHGWAGLFHSVWCAATHHDRLADILPGLEDKLAVQLSSTPPDDSGLLTGTSGVELVRHALHTNRPPRTQWDACLLLNH